MSVKQMGQVWDLDLPPLRKLVLLALADHADHDGERIYPSVGRIAYKTGLSHRQVQYELKALRDNDNLIVLVRKGGGRGNPSEYKLDLEKGEQLAPFNPKRVHGVREKGAHRAPEPSIEPSTTTTKEKELPKTDGQSIPLDDVTGQALVILKRVKGFPRDQAQNAIYLWELREEFPEVDVVETVRQYELWHRDNPQKSKRYRSRLREFFKKANSDSSGRVVQLRPVKDTNGKSSSPPAVVEALANYDRDGITDLRRFAPLARQWDFTSQQEIPWEILRQVSTNQEERDRLLTRIRSVAQRAMREAI